MAWFAGRVCEEPARAMKSIVLVRLVDAGNPDHLWWSYHYVETTAEALTQLLRSLPLPTQGGDWAQPEPDGTWSIVCGSFIVGTITANAVLPIACVWRAKAAGTMS